jgi:hypothetical protein
MPGYTRHFSDLRHDASRSQAYDSMEASRCQVQHRLGQRLADSREEEGKLLQRIPLQEDGVGHTIGDQCHLIAVVHAHHAVLM